MAAAASESSSGLPGADDVGDVGGSALGRLGGGAEAEGGAGGGDVEEGRLAAELRRVSTIVSRSPEAWRGFLSSSPLVSSRQIGRAHV